MFAVIGRGLFYEVAPTRFGTLGKAFFTLFQLITLDDWFYMYSDVVAKSPGFYCHPRRRPKWLVTWLRAKRTSVLDCAICKRRSEFVFLFRQSFEWRWGWCKSQRHFKLPCDSQFCFCGKFAARTKLRMTLDCSKIAKEIAIVSGIFFLGYTVVRKITKIFESN